MFTTSITRLCFVAMIFLGVVCIVIGVVVIPVLPHFQLDVVLTQEELMDVALRSSTLAMLKRASGNQWLFWTLVGVVQLAIGLIGMLADKKRTTADIPSGS